MSERLEVMGWSQADLHRETGISQKHISEILTGKAGGSRAQLEFIAFAIGCRWRVTLDPAHDHHNEQEGDDA